MKKTVKNLLVMQAQLQLVVLGTLVRMVPGEKAKQFSEFLMNDETMTQMRHCTRNISMLPAFPGTKAFQHNLKYTTPWVEYFAQNVNAIFAS